MTENNGSVWRENKLDWSDKYVTLQNQAFRNLNCFYESFNLLNFFIQPHVMHINNVPLKAVSKLHSHKAFECSMVISGLMTYTINDRKVEIPAESTIIIPPNIPHCWCATQASTIFSLMSFISCHGDGSRERMNQLNDAITRFNYNIKNFINMKSNFDMIIQEVKDQSNGFDEKIQCLTRSIYIELFRKLLPPQNLKRRSLRMPPKRGDTAASVVDHVYFYVQDNLARNIKIQDISSFIGISKNHLNRIFKNKHGITIHKYITTRRINIAESLLQSTDRPLKEVATLVGYEDTDYFCRVFKKHKGMTPSQFRQNKPDSL